MPGGLTYLALMDWVALASVVATGAVGLGSLVVTYRSNVVQRRHEARLAHSARVWEQKSQALLDVITIARGLIDTLDSPYEWRREMFGVRLAEQVQGLDELVAVVEAHASRECREAFESLRSLLAGSKPDSAAATTIDVLRRHKVEAIDAGNFDKAALARDRERTTVAQANEAVQGLDKDEVRKRARRVIETARASLRE